MNMDDLVAQLDYVLQSWETTYERLLPLDTTWQPYLPGANLQSVNEAVHTAIDNLRRVRSPTGFTPVFHLAKAAAVPTVTSMLATARALESGQYNQLPTFVSALLQLINVMHTLTIFAQRNPEDTLAADLTTQQAQAIASVNTAQRELASKIELLERAESTADSVDEAKAKIDKLAAQIEQAVDDAQVSVSDLAEIVKSSDDEKSKIIEQGNQTAKLLDQNQSADSVAKMLLAQIKKIHTESEKQQETIRSLLPKGASAGLAAAFASRGQALEWPKRTWIILFAGSLFGLTGVAIYLLLNAPPQDTNYWHFVIFRMPLAAPLIWLAWFSAIQYGNIVRVQEDYAFKEATSKAFQGYRDHMQYLADIDEGEGNTAMNKLADRTIEILAREPLRIYRGSSHDASPWHSFLHRNDGRDKNQTEAPNPPPKAD